MPQTYQSTLLQILTIIQYTENKENFINEFEKQNQDETLANLLDKLPEDIQTKIKDDGPSTIHEYIHASEYAFEYKKVSEEALAKLIEDVSATLTPHQIDEIVALFPEIENA